MHGFRTKSNYSVVLATSLSQHTKTRHAAEMSAESLSNNRNAMH